MTNLNAPDNRRTCEPTLDRITQRLSKKLSQDQLVKQTTFNLRTSLNVDRVVIYYFYRKWQGQVTFECLSNSKFSILGMTGADECFNQDHATLYQMGRTRAITDIELEPISQCHRDFLSSIQVKSNLAVPILTTSQGLWGLLIAHHCQNTHSWSDRDIHLTEEAAKTLAGSAFLR